MNTNVTLMGCRYFESDEFMAHANHWWTRTESVRGSTWYCLNHAPRRWSRFLSSMNCRTVESSGWTWARLDDGTFAATTPHRIADVRRGMLSKCSQNG